LSGELKMKLHEVLQEEENNNTAKIKKAISLLAKGYANKKYYRTKVKSDNYDTSFIVTMSLDGNKSTISFNFNNDNGSVTLDDTGGAAIQDWLGVSSGVVDVDRFNRVAPKELKFWSQKAPEEMELDEL